MYTKNISSWWAYLIILIMAVLSRVLPHPPNMTLMASIGMMTGILYSRKIAALLTFFALMSSDAILYFLQDVPAIGNWTIFTYVGFLILIFLYPSVKKAPLRHLLLRAFFAALFYYLWTNLGVLFYSNLYPITISGSIDCYTRSLPFLGWSFIGNLFGSFLFYFLFAKILGNDRGTSNKQ